MELERKLKITKETVLSPNLTGEFSERDLATIGGAVWKGFEADKASRGGWEKRTQAAMDLAMQVSETKNFPWPDCSNVAFPLVTIAALQFHARAYPALIQGREIIKCNVNGPDPEGVEAARALRISQHMSYQVLEEDLSWEEQHDRLLINIPIVGCAFKKSFHSSAKASNKSELVLAKDLIMNYYAKSTESCARKTHILPTDRNEVYEGIMEGFYRDVREEGWYTSYARPLTDETAAKENNRAGTVTPQGDDETPFTFLEQHVSLDLDGDGYKEPYVVTIEATSRYVVRIVTRFDRMEDIQRNAKGQIIRIRAMEYFTKYGFIPSPDGGIYDVGFGTFLGPLNNSVNSLLNQLIDSGTMSNTAGGFLGRGAKVRGGVYTFAPLEWKRVDATGDDLRKSIFPLPVREPSAVLFNLLTLLINYTNRISGTTDTMVGENPGQNTPAQTTQTMIEQGMKIYSAVFKRVWRSMKEEFRKLYILNAIYLPDTKMFGPKGGRVLREDYLGDPNRISPVADPNQSSSQGKIQQAITIKQSAMQTPGYNIEAVERNFLRAMGIPSEDAEILYPGPSKVPQGKDPKMAIAEMKLQADAMKLKSQEMQFMAQLLEDRRVNTAQIHSLEAAAAKALAEAGGAKHSQEIAAFNAAIGAMRAHDDRLQGRIKLLIDSMGKDNESSKPALTPPDGGGMDGMAAAPGDAVAPGMAPAMQGGLEGSMG